MMSLRQYIDEAMKLNASTAISEAMMSVVSRRLPPKNSGTITKTFFIHWCGRIMDSMFFMFITKALDVVCS